MQQEREHIIGGRRLSTAYLWIRGRGKALLAVLAIVVFLYLPLMPAAEYLESRHRPEGTVLLGALNLAIAIVGLLLLSSVWPTLREAGFWMPTWVIAYACVLIVVAYDSLAHVLSGSAMPTLDQLLPNGHADVVRQAIFYAGLVITVVSSLVLAARRGRHSGAGSRLPDDDVR